MAKFARIHLLSTPVHKPDRSGIAAVTRVHDEEHHHDHGHGEHGHTHGAVDPTIATSERGIFTSTPCKRPARDTTTSPPTATTVCPPTPTKADRESFHAPGRKRLLTSRVTVVTLRKSVLFTRVVEISWKPRPLRRTVPGRPSRWASGKLSGSG